MEDLDALAAAVSHTLLQLDVSYDAIRIDRTGQVVIINGVSAQAPRQALEHALQQARLHAEAVPAGPGYQIRVSPARS
jgi:hypothetical protein